MPKQGRKGDKKTRTRKSKTLEEEKKSFNSYKKHDELNEEEFYDGLIDDDFENEESTQIFKELLKKTIKFNPGKKKI